MKLHSLRLRQHRDGRGGRVHAPLRLRRGHPLHPVHPGLELQPAVHVLPGEGRGGLLDAARLGRRGGDELEPPTGFPGEHLVHSEQVRGEERGLVAPRARADLEDHSGVVRLVRGEQEMRERLLERGGRLFQRREFILRHLRHLRVDAGRFGDDLLERRRLVAAFLDGGVRADDAFGARELFIDARDFGGRRRGIGDERGDERVVARGDGLQTSLQRGGHDGRTSRGGAPVRSPAR